MKKIRTKKSMDITTEIYEELFRIFNEENSHCSKQEFMLTIGEIIVKVAKGIYKIPMQQREFKKIIEEMSEIIFEWLFNPEMLVETNKILLVYDEETGEFWITDGQQRITTLIAFVYALEKLVMINGDTYIIKDLFANQTKILNLNINDPKVNFKLKFKKEFNQKAEILEAIKGRDISNFNISIINNLLNVKLPITVVSTESKNIKRVIDKFFVGKNSNTAVTKDDKLMCYMANTSYGMSRLSLANKLKDITGVKKSNIKETYWKALLDFDSRLNNSYKNGSTTSRREFVDKYSENTVIIKSQQKIIEEMIDLCVSIFGRDKVFRKLNSKNNTLSNPTILSVLDMLTVMYEITSGNNDVVYTKKELIKNKDKIVKAYSNLKITDGRNSEITYNVSNELGMPNYISFEKLISDYSTNSTDNSNNKGKFEKRVTTLINLIDFSIKNL